MINGRKQFISNGYDAGLYVVYANTNPKVGMLQGTSSFLVPRDTPGLTVARCNETLGCRFMNNGELVFEDMRVPDDHLLVENDALGKAGVYFRPGKIIQASKNLGVGVRAFEVTSDYVQNYVQGGRILIKHQAVALRIADMATRIEAVRALLERAARAVDDNAPDADTLCNMVKLFASEEIMKVAQHAVELHGGNGMMLDFGVEKLFRDAAIFLHMDATTDISRLKIVKSMFPHTAGKYAGPESLTLRASLRGGRRPTKQSPSRTHAQAEGDRFSFARNARLSSPRPLRHAEADQHHDQPGDLHQARRPRREKTSPSSSVNGGTSEVNTAARAAPSRKTARANR